MDIGLARSDWRPAAEGGSTPRERFLSKVFAVQMQQIEGVKDDAVGSDSYGRLKRLEVRTAIAILDYGLTINDCRLAAETSSRADDAGIAVAPIMSIPAKDTHLAAINHHLRAMAIVFDFMNPVLPLWRLFNRGGKLCSMKLRRAATRDMRL